MIDINKHAKNMMLGITEEEKERILNNLNDLINQINKVEEYEEEPKSHPHDLYLTSMREDEVVEQVSNNELFSNTKNLSGDFVEVPKVVN